MAFSAVVMTIALYAQNTLVPQATEVIAAVMFFFSTGFVPLDQFPKWLQPFAEHQPCSYVVEAMRGLSMGGPVAKPVIGTLLWSAGIAAIIAVPLAIGYRRASRRD
jgi:ABC-2 type transport system permease protein